MDLMKAVVLRPVRVRGVHDSPVSGFCDGQELAIIFMETIGGEIRESAFCVWRLLDWYVNDILSGMLIVM